MSIDCGNCGECECCNVLGIEKGAKSYKCSVTILDEECNHNHNCRYCDKIEREYDNIVSGVNDLIEGYNKIIEEYSKRHPEEVDELELKEVQKIIKQYFS